MTSFLLRGLAALALALSLVPGATADAPAGPTTVPDVVGLAADAAEAMVREAGFEPRIEAVEAAPGSQVGYAVSQDPASLGLGSTLAIPENLTERGARVLAIAARGSEISVPPDAAHLAAGDYPLYHYLHVACHEASGSEASGFVTYLHSGRGQRMIARRGYVPAREVARTVKITSDPVGAKRT